MLLQGRAMIGPKLQDGEPSTCKVLPMAQVFVTDDEQIKACGFCIAERIAVFQFSPTHVYRGPDFMNSLRLTNRVDGLFSTSTSVSCGGEGVTYDYCKDNSAADGTSP